MNWNWDHIRYFLALAEHGTLSLSARTLGVSHSTVLRRIKQLESDLNTQLFDQTSNGYTLSSAGKTLHVEAVKMRSTMSAISREISGADEQMQGEVVITTTDTLSRYIMPKLIANLSEQYADIRFSLFMANKVSDMETRDVDIAIRTSKKPPENLIGRQVGKIRFVAVASREYVKKHKMKKFPDQTDTHKIITLDDSYKSAPFHQWLTNQISRTTSVTTVNNFLSAAALAKEGLGITVVPDYLLNAEHDLIRLNTKTDISHNDLCVLSHSDSRNTEKIRVVRQYLYEKLPQLLDEEAISANGPSAKPGPP